MAVTVTQGCNPIALVGVTEPTGAEETDVQFEVNVAPVGAWSVVAVAGEVDVATAPRLRKETIALVSAGHYRVVLDLEAVDFLDSTGLGVLIGVLRRVGAVGGELRVVCSTPRIVDLFTVTGLDRVFDLRPTLADALADVPADGPADDVPAAAADAGEDVAAPDAGE